MCSRNSCRTEPALRNTPPDIASATLSSLANSRVITSDASLANSSAARLRTRLATSSPVSAAFSTVRNKSAKLGGGIEFANRMNESISGTFHCWRIRPSSSVAWFSSRARSTSATAVRPIHCPDPSSDIAWPQPPARKISPDAFLPNAIDPVPAITITPGPSPNAAYIVVSVSPTTITCEGTNSAIAARTTFAISTLPAPDAPAHTQATSAGLTPASTQASLIAVCRFLRAKSSPLRTMLLPPLLAIDSTRFSSPTTHVVLVPPPSIPR